MTAPYARPRGVAITRADDVPDGAGEPHIYVALLPSGPLMILEGSAVVVWDAATSDSPEERTPSERPPEDLVVAGVAEAVGVDGGDVREDVLVLLDDLVRRGLLVPAPTVRAQP